MILSTATYAGAAEGPPSGQVATSESGAVTGVVGQTNDDNFGAASYANSKANPNAYVLATSKDGASVPYRFDRLVRQVGDHWEVTEAVSVKDVDDVRGANGIPEVQPMGAGNPQVCETDGSYTAQICIKYSYYNVSGSGGYWTTVNSLAGNWKMLDSAFSMTDAKVKMGAVGQCRTPAGANCGYYSNYSVGYLSSFPPAPNVWYIWATPWKPNEILLLGSVSVGEKICLQGKINFKRNSNNTPYEIQIYSTPPYTSGAASCPPV